MTFWLSFAGDTFNGAVLVDDCEDFLGAHAAASLAGANPGGQCIGFPISPDIFPDEATRNAFNELPRLTVLSKDDLRVLGPLVNTNGEER